MSDVGKRALGVDLVLLMRHLVVWVLAHWEEAYMGK